MLPKLPPRIRIRPIPVVSQAPQALQVPQAPQVPQVSHVPHTPKERLSVLDRVGLLLSQEEQSNEKTDWEYIISLFTDIDKGQQEIVSKLDNLIDLSHGAEDPLILTFPGDIIIITTPEQVEKNSFKLPYNFMGIDHIPYLMINGLSLSLGLQQLIQLETYRKNEELLDLYKIIANYV
jgi:hypothetical protein